MSTDSDTAALAPWHVVRVYWPDGTSHIDSIRGWDRADAVARAEWNWGTANPVATCERIEYLHPDEEHTAAEPDARPWMQPCCQLVEADEDRTLAAADDDVDVDEDGV